MDPRWKRKFLYPNESILVANKRRTKRTNIFLINICVVLRRLDHTQSYDLMKSKFLWLVFGTVTHLYRNTVIIYLTIPHLFVKLPPKISMMEIVSRSSPVGTLLILQHLYMIQHTAVYRHVMRCQRVNIILCIYPKISAIIMLNLLHILCLKSLKVLFYIFVL